MEASLQGGSQKPDRARRSRVLITRVLVGAVLIPIVVFINYLGGLPFAAFVALLAGIGCREFCEMFRGTISSRLKWILVVGSACLCLSFHYWAIEGAALVLTILLTVILVECLVRQDREVYASAAGISVMGLVYTGWLLGFFVLLRGLGLRDHVAGAQGDVGSGGGFVLLVLILTWSYDSMAYFGGSFLGRHKLFSRISPSKTVEGTLFGLGGCIAAALISKATFAGYLGWPQAVMVGLLLGVVAQIGDLVESMMKRSTGTKDSSKLIPGHGGLLDRFDSLLLTGPAFYFYLRLAGAMS